MVSGGALFDCDDNNDRAYPGAGFNESTTACMLDDDLDGYGTDTVTGTIVAGNDCDDSDITINPGATDTPGDIYDQNCSGTIVCYNDDDRDGFGNSDGTSGENGTSPSAEGGVAITSRSHVLSVMPTLGTTITLIVMIRNRPPILVPLKPRPLVKMARVWRTGDAGWVRRFLGRFTGDCRTNCDDGDPEINPCAVEICDDADNDCDGSKDAVDTSYGEVPQMWWLMMESRPLLAARPQ